MTCGLRACVERRFGTAATSRRLRVWMALHKFSITSSISAMAPKSGKKGNKKEKVSKEVSPENRAAAIESKNAGNCSLF